MVGKVVTDDIGALFQASDGSGDNWAEGAGNDGVAVIGAYKDKSSFGSCKVVVAFTAVLAANATLSATVGLKDATDNEGTGAADFVAPIGPKIIATGPGGGGTVKGTAEFDFNLAGARQFVASNIKLQLSHAADTVQVGRVLLMGGAKEEPCSLRLN